MRRLSFFGSAAIFLFVSGCSDPRVEELGREQLRLTKEVAEEMEKATKPGDVSSSPSKKKLAEVNAEVAQLPWPKQKVIEDRYGSQLTEYKKKIEASLERLGKRAGS